MRTQIYKFTDRLLSFLIRYGVEKKGYLFLWPISCVWTYFQLYDDKGGTVMLFRSPYDHLNAVIVSAFGGAVILFFVYIIIFLVLLGCLNWLAPPSQS